MPANLQEGMHDREVVEWLQTDTNLVGCIERKARVVKARSYDHAAAQLAADEAGGDWHFCRGVLEVDNMEFKTYDDVEAGEKLPDGAWRPDGWVGRPRGRWSGGRRRAVVRVEEPTACSQLS
jgi:hypothetical protein